MKKSLILLTALLLVTISAFAGNITPQEAKDHVGEVATVTGSVDGFKSLKRETFLDMGGRYPMNSFTVFSPSRNGISPLELKKLEGKVISVSGTIVLYRGKPEMVLSSLLQIAVQ